MRVAQYVYFALSSEDMPAAAIAAHLGIEPDEVLVRGARRMDPPRPVLHSWKLVCRERGLRVDEQVDRVIARLGLVADRIAELTRREVEAKLVIVRQLDADADEDSDGESERHDPVLLPDGRELEALGGQHHLLGWSLDAPTIAFLARAGAYLDVDEYG